MTAITQGPVTCLKTLGKQADDPDTGFRRWQAPAHQLELIIHEADIKRVIDCSYKIELLWSQIYIRDQLHFVHPARIQRILSLLNQQGFTGDFFPAFYLAPHAKVLWAAVVMLDREMRGLPPITPVTVIREEDTGYTLIS